MNSAVWGLAGTVVGGLLAVLSTWTLGVMQRRQNEQAEQARLVRQAREERKRVYLQLLTTCRRLRFVAREEATPDDEASLRSDLSVLTYEIDLISSEDISTAAQTLAQATRAYLRTAAALRVVDADERSQEEMDAVERERINVRTLVDEFINRARADLAEGRASAGPSH